MVRSAHAFLARLCLAGLLAALSAWLVTMPRRPAPSRPQPCGPAPQQAPAAWPLVALDADPGKPGLHRHRPRHLGPQDPRARLYPGRRRWDLSPLVHRLRRRPPHDHVARPRHFARRHSLDPRPRQPDLHRIVGRRHVRRPPATARTSCSPRGRTTSPTCLTSTDGLKWTDHGSLDIRKTDGTPIDPGPYGTPTAWFENGTWYLFYERGDQGIWLATSKDLKVWTNVKDDPVIAMGPEPYDKTAVALNQVVKRDGFYYAILPRQRAPALEETGPPAWPARATWSTGRNTRATRSSRTTARARSWCEPPRARTGSTPCTRM